MDLDGARALLGRVRRAVGSVVLGQDAVVDQVLLCLLAGGHGLLEGVPGLGKTLLVRALAHSMDLRFNRVQCTPDLMPGDITGTRVVSETPDGQRQFTLVKGPVFTQLLLADEVNRATPRTQSALLEAMQEAQVTLHGERHPLEEPFFVLATQNPIEQEGTYPLPEAQLDRFLLKILVPRPDPETLLKILGATTAGPVPMPEPVATTAEVLAVRRLVREVLVATPVLSHATKMLAALDPEDPKAHPDARACLRLGPGVRGGQALVLAAKARAVLDGRAHIAFEDLRAVALPALRHRVLLSFEGEARGATPDALVSAALKSLEEPARDVP
ncbi:MAG: MoxR family ATPase [Deltaproteobacteria bacterium]|nr:MoxR family ATPase [Deltaproteobacteria bacterium]